MLSDFECKMFEGHCSCQQVLSSSQAKPVRGPTLSARSCWVLRGMDTWHVPYHMLGLIPLFLNRSGMQARYSYLCESLIQWLGLLNACLEDAA
jgi:hypothetical protein